MIQRGCSYFSIRATNSSCLPTDETSNRMPNSSYNGKINYTSNKSISLSGRIWNSFAQRRYSNQWSDREVLLLLVENYTQYPAPLVWNTTGWSNFWQFLREHLKEEALISPRWVISLEAVWGRIWAGKEGFRKLWLKLRTWETTFL